LIGRARASQSLGLGWARTSPVIARFVKRLDRYGPPNAEERAALLSILTPPKTYSAQQEVIKQFSAPTESTLLLRGMMGRVVSLQSGVQQITALQVSGDFVDLHAFLLARMDHSIVALTDCIATTAPHEALRRLTDRYPRLARALWYLTLVDASIHRHWLTVIGRRDALGRMAHLFCELYVRLHDVGLAQDQCFALPLTQAEIGDVLSLSTVHVNRVAQDLRARGLIIWERRKVTVTAWEELRAVAEFDPTYLQLEDQIAN
jgi:CRP-like cAMP-binding protein